MVISTMLSKLPVMGSKNVLLTMLCLTLRVVNNSVDAVYFRYKPRLCQSGYIVCIVSHKAVRYPKYEQDAPLQLLLRWTCNACSYTTD